jgi:predicted flap endonuclease-1-like 5' DNA nuclease
MSKLLVFTVAFVAILGLTLIFPILPPGEILFNLMGISVESLSIIGISGNVLVAGIINGAFWGLIFLGFYALANRISNREDLPPMPTQPYIPEPVPLKTEVVYPAKPAPVVIKRKTFVPLDQEIETIEGIGPTYGNKFRRMGIRVVEDLLCAGSTRKRRLELASELGVAPKTLLKWVYRADFFRLRGIGKQYSSLLESAGVNTVNDLSRRNPKNLYLLLKETNKEKNLVKRIPPLSLIQDWVDNSKMLKTMVLS